MFESIGEANTDHAKQRLSTLVNMEKKLVYEYQHRIVKLLVLMKRFGVEHNAFA
jgi:hypothetical protein